MLSLKNKLSHCFAAGALGGLAYALAMWGMGALGIAGALGVQMDPDMNAAFLCGKIVWGGIWGLILIFPVASQRPWLKGLIVSLGPTLAQLFIIFPLTFDKGTMGLDLGAMTPFFIIVYNALWGITAAYWRHEAVSGTAQPAIF